MFLRIYSRFDSYGAFAFSRGLGIANTKHRFPYGCKTFEEVTLVGDVRCCSTVGQPKIQNHGVVIFDTVRITVVICLIRSKTNLFFYATFGRNIHSFGFKLFLWTTAVIVSFTFEVSTAVFAGMAEPVARSTLRLTQPFTVVRNMVRELAVLTQHASVSLLALYFSTRCFPCIEVAIVPV